MMEKNWVSQTFYRWMCKNYRRGSAISFFFKRRITPLAWFVMGLLGLSMLVGANLAQSVTVLLSALLSCTLGIGLLWALLRRARVVISREVPS
ncbi:hypothetical protein N9Z19_01375, partial [Akkermansiaceae bacterium]|nr:hypothetical protein [Akkermansiaceae bacterium]